MSRWYEIFLNCVNLTTVSTLKVIWVFWIVLNTIEFICVPFYSEDRYQWAINKYRALMMKRIIIHIKEKKSRRVWMYQCNHEQELNTKSIFCIKMHRLGNYYRLRNASKCIYTLKIKINPSTPLVHTTRVGTGYNWVSVGTSRHNRVERV